MAGTSVAPSTGGCITVNLFDGTRKPIAPGTEVLITVMDGNHKLMSREYHRNSSVVFSGLPLFNNWGDEYTVIAYADGYKQAGFQPVPVAANVDQVVDLMLVPSEGHLNFSGASWKSLGDLRPSLQSLFAQGAETAAAAETRYGDIEEKEDGKLLACLLNITTAMSQIQLPQRNALQYLKLVQWDRIAQDRFFAFADPMLLNQVKLAIVQKKFKRAPGALHEGATCSFKQVEFGEANVQLTFHESDRCEVDGKTCILVEPDIDYYKDSAAHFIGEVIVNAFGNLTDPTAVYVLRWMAGRRAGLPEFDPLYTIVKD